MPYMVVKQDNEFCVYKHDEDNNPVGDSLGCHDTREEANRQIAALYANEPGAAKATVKAVGDGEEWTLDVLGNPWYGPENGRDADGEYFSPQTDFHADKYNLPPVVYYHGLGPDGKPSGKPEYIGKTVAREVRPDGVWYRVVLDRAKDLASRIWEAAKNGLARASSGSVPQLVRIAPDGHIKEWPVVELSLLELDGGKRPANGYAVALPVMKAVYEQAGIEWPDVEISDVSGAETDSPEADTQGAGVSETSGAVEIETIKAMEDNMAEETTTLSENRVAELIAEAFKADREAQKAELEAEKARKEEIEAAIKAEREKWEEEAKKARRLPFSADDAPVVGQFGDLRKYQHLEAGDMACMIDVLKAAGKPVSETAYRDLAIKTVEDKGEIGAHAGLMLKAQGITDATKANEVNYSTLASYGDEWVTTANATQLWENIRQESNVGSMIPSIEVPQGSESVLIPLEGTDPVFYKVSQVASDADTGGLQRPLPTVTSSRLGTANNTLSVNKMGARIRWSGELEEDSIVPFAPQLRRQMGLAGQEYFDHVILDGDTRTTASVNINDAAGTPAGTEAYLLFNGLRYTALATSGRNRSGGAIDEDDFVATMALLGTAGEAADPDRCAFIVDVHTHRKMLTEITALKTADVYPGSPTITSGRITQIWGYPVIVSHQMGYVHTYSPHTMTGYEKKFTTSGYIDQDTSSGANNTTGLMLLVRWDRWYLGWKRRMTMEVTRHPEWDGSEIVALMRFGLLARDTTNAVACTYNITV